MFSLSNNIIKNIFLYTIIACAIIILQAYMPKILFFQNLYISVDFFLVFLTFLVLKNQIYQIIILAFFVGLFQDLVIQVQMIGSFALIKSISVYFIGMSKNFNHLWSKYLKIFYLFIIYMIHFIIYFYIVVNNDISIIFILSVIQSIISIILFSILERLFFNSSIL